MPTLATFNANNFFLRYKFANTYSGGEQNQAAIIEAAEVANVGYLPGRAFGRYAQTRYIVWDPSRRELAFDALLAPDNKLPDILCLQEVENIDSIRILNERYFGGHYQYSLLIDGYDPRNIDVGLLSRYPIKHVRSHIDDINDQGIQPFRSRDCLEVDIELYGDDLTLYINHLKSKYINTRDNPSAAEKRRRIQESHNKRLLQAQAVADLIDKRFRGQHSSALYAVVGDLNDTPESPWLAPLSKNAKLTNILAKHVPEEDRWTYYWRSKNRVSQIDYVLASRALSHRIADKIQQSPDSTPHIERAGLAFRTLNADGLILPSQTNLVRVERDELNPEGDPYFPDIKIPFRFERYTGIIDDWKNNISDHCPVKVWF